MSNKQAQSELISTAHGTAHPLRSLVLKLTALMSGHLTGAVGELAHAAFYATIRAVDPVLSARMHDEQTRSAFSLSPLHGFASSENRSMTKLHPGQSGWLRIGILDTHLFQTFMDYILNASSPVLHIGQTQLVITEVLGTPESHPWAGYTTLEELARVQEVRWRWVLEFASPTAIRWGEAGNGVRRVEVFPMPRMALAGLRSRWDKLTGETWGREFEEWVEQNVVVGRIWRWETATVAFQRQHYTGGMGKLEYRLLDTSHTVAARHLHRLLQLGFYTGIGTKTTHGLGQMRLLACD
jgi:CRISPR-associated endoribonuclease Cas6